MQPPYAVSDQYVSLGTDEIEYETGQSATIRARLRGAGGDAIGDATVDALLIQNDQVVASVPLSIDDPDRGNLSRKDIAAAIECLSGANSSEWIRRTGIASHDTYLGWKSRCSGDGIRWLGREYPRGIVDAGEADIFTRVKRINYRKY